MRENIRVINTEIHDISEYEFYEGLSGINRIGFFCAGFFIGTNFIWNYYVFTETVKQQMKTKEVLYEGYLSAFSNDFKHR